MNNIKAFKWLQSFFSCFCALIILIVTVTYIVDPFFQFRTHNGTYILNERYVFPGLIKNYDYDTIMFGSSMTQNFNMDEFDEKLNTKSLRASLSGMGLTDLINLLTHAYDINKAQHYYICIDLASFANDAESRIPEYLYGSDILSILKYSTNYEAWLRYIPLDIAMFVANKLGIDTPSSLKSKTNLAKIGNWSLDYKFSEEAVIEHYFSVENPVSAIDLTDLEKRMKKNIDMFFDTLDVSKGEHILFMPPYSSFYWYHTQEKLYFEQFLEYKEYFIEKATAEGCIFYDFQHADFTLNLDNYKDISHYSPEINSFMIDCFANQQYIANNNNKQDIIDRLVSNTNKFKKAYDIDLKKKRIVPKH